MAQTQNDDLLTAMMKAYLETRKVISAASQITNNVVTELTKTQPNHKKPGPIIVEPTETTLDNDETVVVGVKGYVTVEAPDLRSCLTKVREIVDEMEEEPSSINISMLWEEGYIYGYEAVLI